MHDFGFEPFHRDRGGAIAMVGLVICPALAALCWYELIVWRQILTREQVQSAADVIAAGGAAWLAAGMNILALINVIMGIVLTFFVAIRAVEILSLGGFALLSGLSILDPGLFTLAMQSLRTGEQAFQKERDVAPKMMRALAKATEAERIVARAMPYVSTAMSMTMVSGDDAGFGIAGNLGLAPTALDRTADAFGATEKKGMATFPERMGRVEQEDDGQPDNRTLKQKLFSRATVENMVGSLPVEGEPYSQLCARAASDWTTVPLVRDIPAAHWIHRILNFIGGNFPVLLCQPLSDAKTVLEHSVEGTVKRAVEDKAKSLVTPGCEKDFANSSDAGALTKCVNDRADAWKKSDDGKAYAKDYKKQQVDEIEKQQGEEIRTDEIETAKVWSLVSEEAAALENREITKLESNGFLDAYSIYLGPDGGDHRAPMDFRILSTLSHANGDRPALQGFQMDWSSARARIFFDCDSEDLLGRSGKGDFDQKCAQNALWRPGGWTWVMGVDLPPGDELAITGNQALGGYVGWFVSEAMQSLLRELGGAIARGGSSRPSRPVWHLYTIWVERIKGTFSHGSARDQLGRSIDIDWWVGATIAGGVTHALPEPEIDDRAYLR